MNVRSGMRLIYTAKEGEKLFMFRDGTTLVVSPNEEPFLVKTDGTRERVKPSQGVPSFYHPRLFYGV